jgi:hypothetical protein
MPRRRPGQHIKRLHWLLVGLLVGIGTVLAFHTIAQSNTSQTIAHGQGAYFNLQDITLRNSPGIPAEADWEAHEAQRIAHEKASRQAKKATNGSFGLWGCVRFAKALTGVYGTWGDGGRRLSLNSNGQVGDVVIFRYIVHVGVISARTGDTITIREWVTVEVAPGKYWAYETARAANVHSLEFLGYHSFNK